VISVLTVGLIGKLLAIDEHMSVTSEAGDARSSSKVHEFCPFFH
jgi:hypothetical protein